MMLFAATSFAMHEEKELKTKFLTHPKIMKKWNFGPEDVFIVRLPDPKVRATCQLQDGVFTVRFPEEVLPHYTHRIWLDDVEYTNQGENWVAPRKSPLSVELLPVTRRIMTPQNITVNDEKMYPFDK